MPSNEDEFGGILKQAHDANENDDLEASAEAIGRVWQHLAEMPDEASPYLEAMKRAHECEERFDWKSAENFYGEALAASADSFALGARCLGSLCAMLALAGDEARAFEAAQQSVVMARRVESPLFRAVALAEALGRESAWHHKRGDNEAARAMLDEQLEIIAANSQVLHALWPRALVQRAGLNIQREDFETARSDLDEAWPMLEARREWTFLTTYQVGLADWWTTEAMICAGQNDRDGEIEARREAVQYRFVVAQAPQLEGPFKFNALAKAWFDLAMALRPVDFAASQEALDESDTLRRNIGLAPFPLIP